MEEKQTTNNVVNYLDRDGLQFIVNKIKELQTQYNVLEERVRILEGDE